MGLRLTEEIMLLALHDEDGEFAEMRDWPLHCALAGGLLMDLLLEGRIAAKPGLLRAVDPDPLGDPLLDPALAEIAAADPPRDPHHWVDHFARQAERLRDEALESLVGHGVLRRESGLFLWVHGSRRYPTAMAEVEAKLRIWAVLLEDEEPEPRDIALIHLAHACHILRKLLPHLQLQQTAKRIEEVCCLDEAGAAVLDAVMDSEVAAGPGHGQPVTEGLPVVGNYADVITDPYRFLREQYIKLGPVFRIWGMHRMSTVLAGPEANRFIARHSARCLRSFDAWGRFGRDMGAGREGFLLAMDGSGHDRMRKAFKKPFGPHCLTDRIPDVIDATHRRMAAWATGKPVPANHELFRLMAEVQARLHYGTSAGEYVDDLVEFIDAEIALQVLRRGGPKFLVPMKYPNYEKHREQVLELLAGIVRQHRTKPRDGTAQHYLDTMLALHEEDPGFLSEADFPATTSLPFLAGIDTVGSTVGFMLYALLDNPDLMMQGTAEADELFAHGTPAPEAVKKLDILRRVMMETLRMYPPLNVMPRTTANTFDFGGYRIPAGEPVLIASTVVHRLPECYPDPERFDIDRYLPERMENSTPGTYAPFGLGTHACLGASFAMMLCPLVVATLLHGLELGRVGRKGPVPVQNLPNLRPADSFAFKVQKRR